MLKKNAMWLIFSFCLSFDCRSSRHIEDFPADDSMSEGSITAEAGDESTSGLNTPFSAQNINVKQSPAPEVQSTPPVPTPVGSLTPNTQIFINIIEPNTPIKNVKWDSLSELHPELFMEEGPTQYEVRQGQDNDCTLYAVIGSLTSVNPEKIKSMIKLAGKTVDGVDVYAVSLFDPRIYILDPNFKIPKEILIDAKFPLVFDDRGNFTMQYDILTTDPKNQNLIIWPMLLQKAAASLFGGYDKIIPSASSQMTTLTGNFSNLVLPYGDSSDDAQRKERLSLALQNQNIVTTDAVLLDPPKANDFSNTLIYSDGLYFCAVVKDQNFCLANNHEYEVLSISEDTVTIRNPWGENKGADPTKNGIFELPFSAFTALTWGTWSASSSIIRSSK